MGRLKWLVISTRPDTSNAVRSIARYSSTLNDIHWNAALGILTSTVLLGLVLHIIEEQQEVFLLNVLLMQPTQVGQLTGIRYIT